MWCCCKLSRCLFGGQWVGFPPFWYTCLTYPSSHRPFGQNRNLYCQLVILVNSEAGRDSVFCLITFNTNPFFLSGAHTNGEGWWIWVYFFPNVAFVVQCVWLHSSQTAVTVKYLLSFMWLKVFAQSVIFNQQKPDYMRSIHSWWTNWLNESAEGIFVCGLHRLVHPKFELIK